MTVSPRLTVSVSGIGVVFENRSSDPLQSAVVLPHQFFECGLIPRPMSVVSSLSLRGAWVIWVRAFIIRVLR